VTKTFRNRSLITAPALAGIAYTTAWVMGVAVWPSNLDVAASDARVVAAYGAHEGTALTQYLLIEGVAAIALAVVALAIGRAARDRGAETLRRAVVAAGLTAAALSLAQCALGLLLAGSVAPAGETDRAGRLFDLINRMDGVKMLALAGMAVAGVGLARRGVLPRWLGYASGCLAVALISSGAGYLLLNTTLAQAVFVSGPLLLIWVTGAGISIAWRSGLGARPAITRKKSSDANEVRSEIGSRRWWALGAVILAVFAVGLDGTVLSVALPTLASSLHASESDLQWFQSGYLLVLATAMLPAGLLGDRYGRKTVMLSALALFGVGSAACAFAPTPFTFIVARAVLALAGAGVIVMALAALTVLFSEDERPRAVGVWAAANFLALPIGPILGGWLLTHFWWGWVFLLNVPVALVGLVAVLALVPNSRASRLPALDLVGVLTSVAGLVAVTYGLIEAGQHGWTSAAGALPILVGLALLIAFAAWERWLGTQPGGEPLVDPTLFRSPSFTWGVTLQAVVIVALIGVLFTMPQYFQGVLGTDAMGSGLRLLPLMGGMALGAIPADRIARLVGAKLAVAGGFALLAGALLLGADTRLDSSTGFIAAWMGLAGVGVGVAAATATSAALVELPEERSGVGSAVMQAVNKIGGPLGSAILGSAVTAAYLARLHLSGLPAPAEDEVRRSVFGGVAVAGQLHSQALLNSVREAFAHGLDEALIVSAGIAIAGAVLALLFLPRASGATDARESKRREELVGTS
jgi:EmrB/QacA subfamily drug resistance transporter